MHPRVTNYRLDEWDLIPNTGRDFFLCHHVQTSSGIQFPIQTVLGTPSLGVKLMEHDAENSPLYNAKVKNIWSFASSLIYHIGAVFRHRHNFIFTFIQVMHNS
jgi:hypothetical protein